MKRIQRIHVEACSHCGGLDPDRPDDWLCPACHNTGQQWEWVDVDYVDHPNKLNGNTPDDLEN